MLLSAVSILVVAHSSSEIPEGLMNNPVYLKEFLWGGLDWIDLAQDRDRWRDIVKAVMNFRVPLNAGNFLTS